MKRKSGYYWVKYKGFWLIAEYSAILDKWWLTSVEESFSENEFEEITEKQIELK